MALVLAGLLSPIGILSGDYFTLQTLNKWEDMCTQLLGQTNNLGGCLNMGARRALCAVKGMVNTLQWPTQCLYECSHV